MSSSLEQKIIGKPVLAPDGTIHVPAFELPISTFLAGESRDQLQRWAKWQQNLARARPGHWTDALAIPAYRRFLETDFYPVVLARFQAVYPVRISPCVINGVEAEIFEPDGGLPSGREKHALINLHGGAFTLGGRSAGRLESIPIAAMGKFRVIALDYRLAPEHEHPAATEDAVAAYRVLLRDFAPEQIGIYGCSAGATLTAQTVARLQMEDLPVPAAVGMFCGSGSYWMEGDSAHWGTALEGERTKALRDYPYFKNADPEDSLVFPVRAPAVLARFPPSLMITATRDRLMSSVIDMHSRLIELNVDARLHVWEGLGHGFFYDPDLPQSRQVFTVVTRFFDHWLGKHGANTP